MKTLILILSIASSYGADKQAERFADKYAKNQRETRHIVEKWTAHCKSVDMVPDPQLGCVLAPKPAPEPAVKAKP